MRIGRHYWVGGSSSSSYTGGFGFSSRQEIGYPDSYFFAISLGTSLVMLKNFTQPTIAHFHSLCNNH
jgi:hypothetical protein